MALPFPSFHTWLWKSPSPNPCPNPNPPANTFPNANPNPNFPVSSADTFAALDVDAFQLSRSSKEKKSSPHKVYGSARRKVSKGGGQRRKRNQSLDLDFDMVIVQPDYFSGSESDGSDWSVGWFEPHAAEFCSDGEPENSFAVLVPCYGSPSPDGYSGKARFGQEEASNPHCMTTNSKSQLWAAVLSNIAKDSHAGLMRSLLSNTFLRGAEPLLSFTVEQSDVWNGDKKRSVEKLSLPVAKAGKLDLSNSGNPLVL